MLVTLMHMTDARVRGFMGGNWISEGAYSHHRRRRVFILVVARQGL